MTGSCQHCNYPSGFVKDGTILDQLIDYKLLKLSLPVELYILRNVWESVVPNVGRSNQA